MNESHTQNTGVKGSSSALQTVCPPRQPSMCVCAVDPKTEASPIRRGAAIDVTAKKKASRWIHYRKFPYTFCSQVGGAESAARRCLKSRETRCALMTASRGAEVLQWRSEQSMLGAMLGFTPAFFS
ncbi:hypothetical protein KOW79_020044 [Hemibagrus wyckioides]|uniref:Uncharacterized protein n=1 Tax=Hemibagrus wyckioides TaxID=337641 RepID=A0A9D3SE69_9TELE|nr:hypothetical protein KOW79_020044 [Hemibagrus wyckioides]